MEVRQNRRGKGGQGVCAAAGDDMPLHRVRGAVLAQYDDAYICHGWMTGAVGLLPLLGPIL